MFLLNYIANIEKNELKDSIVNTAVDLYSKISICFDFKSHITGLLLGHVQSGKTGQVFGCITKLADEGFRVFVLLTTDNVYLYQQLVERAHSQLNDFSIVGEYDDIKLFDEKLSRPTIVLLKKNTYILKKWRNTLSSSNLCFGNPIVIFDDEADAASLNTLINKNRNSTINNHIKSIKALGTSSIYIEVTATPQSVLLQSTLSGWKPSFIVSFDPGKNYVGGNFFYSEPASFCIRYTNEDELNSIRSEDEYIPTGLQNSLMSFLTICGHFIAVKELTANFLIHPSVKISDHNYFAQKIGEHVNLLIQSYEDEGFEALLKEAWLDLQATQPDLTSYQTVKNNVITLLEESKVNIIVLNSTSPFSINYATGFNIIIGGNSLSRGLTLPKLQTIYYCRKTKKPQADTYWQHSRVFGYDRVPNLIRIYIPATLHRLFTNLNNSNNYIYNQIKNYGIDKLQLIFPDGIQPTRSNVLDKKIINVICGGTNYFPNDPIDYFTSELDGVLAEYTDVKQFEEVDFCELMKILKFVGSTESADWDSKKFINCINAFKKQNLQQKCYLIVRRNRDVTKGTGTLLSPNDRSLGSRFNQNIVLTMYRVNGKIENYWNGKPLWIPNIKFPSDICFYDTLDVDVD